MPITDYRIYLHGKSDPVNGVAFCQSGTANAEDEINTAMLAPALGENVRLGVHVHIKQTYNNLTTLTFTVQHSDTEMGASAGPEYSTRHFSLSALTAGKHFFFPFSPGGRNLKRYIGLRGVVVGTNNPTTGKIVAYIGPPDGTETW